MASFGGSWNDLASILEPFGQIGSILKNLEKAEVLTGFLRFQRVLGSNRNAILVFMEICWAI